MSALRSLCGGVLICLLASAAGADESAGKKATHKVEQGPFKVEVTLKGVFESSQMTPFLLALEGWTKQAGSPLLVHKAVEQGAVVRKGDTLLWLDLDRLDQTIHDLEAERHLDELALSLAEKELPLLEQAAPLELASTERAKQMADEDLHEFLKTGRAFAEKWADFQLKSARHSLEYAQEELRQLEKMYKANDLTEETEEIILKRQRNQLEFAVFFVKYAEKEREETYRIDLPRRDRHLKEHAQRQTHALEKLRVTQPLQLTQKKLAVNKLRYEHAKVAERLARLQRDRAQLACKAPADGVVYYGRCVHGQWNTQTSMADRLQRGGEVHPEEVILTIVGAAPIFVRAEVDEKDLARLQDGMAGKVVPTAYPDQKLAARLEHVSPVPVAAGKFLAQFKVDLPATARPVPGMACSVKLVPYRKTDALTVPASAVFTDELDEDHHYVYLAASGQPAVRRDVKTGAKTETRVEVLEGLRAGDEILQQKPEGMPAASAGKETKR